MTKRSALPVGAIAHPPMEATDDLAEYLDGFTARFGYEDAAGLELLRAERLLTSEQQASIADGIAPVLDQTQVDRVFDRYPTLTAIAAGGQPFPGRVGKVTYAPAAAGCDGGAPVRSSYEITPSENTSPAALGGAPCPSSGAT